MNSRGGAFTQLSPFFNFSMYHHRPWTTLSNPLPLSPYFSRGKRNENLLLNHLTNIALSAGQLPEKLTTLGRKEREQN